MESGGPALASLSHKLLLNLTCLEKEGSAPCKVHLTWTLNALLSSGYPLPHKMNLLLLSLNLCATQQLEC